MSVDLEIPSLEVGIQCSECRSGLEVTDTQVATRARPLTLCVATCDNCLEDAHESGADEGESSKVSEILDALDVIEKSTKKKYPTLGFIIDEILGLVREQVE